MPLDAVSNFVRGNTDENVDNSQTTISVVSADIFPDPSTQGEYNVVLWDADNFPRPDQDADVEVLRVTSIDTTGDSLTVTRAQEGTNAASHPSGSAVHLTQTAKMFSDIESTFNEFYDSATQELTADVNNQSVSTGIARITKQARVESTDLAISGGSIPYDAPFIRIASEDGSADNLDEITDGANNGNILILSSQANAADITLRHNEGTGGTGLRLDGQSNFTLTNTNDKIILIYNAAGERWNEISRSDNAV